MWQHEGKNKSLWERWHEQDKSYKQCKQMSIWPTLTVLELFWLASVEHLSWAGFVALPMLWRQANRGTEKTSLSLPRAWGKQGAFSSYRVPPKQGSHAQSVPELETAERQPGSSSEFDIRYSFLPLLFNFIRSKGKKNPFEFLLFFLNRKKETFFFQMCSRY